MNGASDVRIKQNIKPIEIEYATNLLQKLNPVEYEFKNQPEKKRFGLIAQEIEEQFKTENLGLHHKQLGEDGIEQQYLSYLELIGPLIKVVNKLVDDVNSLKTENQYLKNQLENLK